MLLCGKISCILLFSGHISKYIMDKRDLLKESTKNVISHEFSEVCAFSLSLFSLYLYTCHFQTYGFQEE